MGPTPNQIFPNASLQAFLFLLLFNLQQVLKLQLGSNYCRNLFEYLQLFIKKNFKMHF